MVHRHEVGRLNELSHPKSLKIVKPGAYRAPIKWPLHIRSATSRASSHRYLLWFVVGWVKSSQVNPFCIFQEDQICWAFVSPTKTQHWATRPFPIYTNQRPSPREFRSSIIVQDELVVPKLAVAPLDHYEQGSTFRHAHLPPEPDTRPFDYIDLSNGPGTC